VNGESGLTGGTKPLDRIVVVSERKVVGGIARMP
jgi:hypothetical protein